MVNIITYVYAMGIPGQVYKAAEIGVYQEIVDQFLHPYWAVIAGNRSGSKDVPLPDACEFERMARELIQSRNAEGGPQFKLPAANGGKVVKINDIKEHLSKLAGSAGASLVSAFGAVGDLPDKGQVHEVASAVERGVARGSSWWNAFLADPLGTIFDLVAGFFTGTLRQRMGERLARNASVAVQRELAEVRKGPGMEALLTSGRISVIGDRVAGEVRHVAASPGGPARPASVGLRGDIQPFTGDKLFKPLAERTLRSYVSEAFKETDPKSGKSARETLMEGTRSDWTLGLIAHGALKEHEANALENRVADAFVKVVTDESFGRNRPPALEQPMTE